MIVLRVDTQIDCSSAGYGLLTFLAVVCGVAFVFGVPCYWM